MGTPWNIHMNSGVSTIHQKESDAGFVVKSNVIKY
jgi:hypothetical protein